MVKWVTVKWEMVNGYMGNGKMGNSKMGNGKIKIINGDGGIMAQIRLNVQFDPKKGSKLSVVTS